MLLPGLPGRGVLLIVSCVWLLTGLSGTAPLYAQEASQQVLTLTLEEAIQIALVHGYAVQSARMDVADANTQVSQGIGTVLPNVELSSGYTRNLQTANPFAGSSAGTLFNSFGFVGWLAYNEDARTDDDPTTGILTFDDYSDRVDEGYRAAGLSLDDSDNPFAVANQFVNGVSVTQTLVDLSKFRTVSGLRHLTRSLQGALDRQEQLIVGQVRQAFYLTLLLQEQSTVAAQSVARTRHTVQEAARLVAQGVAPKARRLSAQVQLANLETQHVQTSNQALTALDNLKFILGIPVDQPVRLSGELAVDEEALFATYAASGATDRAVELRPDLQQLYALRDLAQINLSAGRLEALPSLSAVANLNYIGSVPSNRTFGRPVKDDPFSFRRVTEGFFSNAYWQPSVSVGVSLQWSLFDGFARRARRQQLQIQLSRAELHVRQATESIRLEVATALRDLQAAQSRIASQTSNVANAELNYTYAQTRLTEGVGTPLEERDASAQLDQSRINYLQAVYDFLLAKSTFETAAGIPLANQSDLRLANATTR